MIKHRLHRSPHPSPLPYGGEPACRQAGVKGEGDKQITQIIILAVSFFSLVNLCFAQALSSNELITNARRYDGQEIIYEGEIIGDIMYRGDFVWINVNDGKNAVGINYNKELTKDIRLLAGGYNRRGDWVKIDGVFNSKCKIHGGDLDIHADKIEIVKKGKILKEGINLQKKQLVYKLTGVLLCLLILRLFLGRLRRQ